MIYGKYSVYIFFSYGVAFLMFSGLVWRVKWTLNQSKRLCKNLLNERQDACNS
jgi:heme exporter protein CcmD